MFARMHPWLRRWGLIGAGLLPAIGAPAAAQDALIPVDLQVSLFARIWTFDRSHHARLSDDLVIGVLYQSQVRWSMLTKEAFVTAASSFQAGEHAVRIVEIDYRDPAGLREAMLRERIDIVYVAPLRAVNVRDIATVTRSLGALTCTGVPAYVSGGLLVGLELRDGRPAILVNREASQREGAVFSSELLKLARLVEAGP